MVLNQRNFLTTLSESQITSCPLLAPLSILLSCENIAADNDDDDDDDYDEDYDDDVKLRHSGRLHVYNVITWQHSSMPCGNKVTTCFGKLANYL